MRTIHTVRGPIVAKDMGAVLCHEHFVFGYPGYSGDLSHNAFKGKVKKEYYDYCKGIFDHLKKDFGVRTVIDPTPNDCGRDVLTLKEIAEYLDINIVVATGYYSELDGAPSYFKFRKAFGSDIVKEAYEMMQKELYDQIEETGIKANFIKLASSRNDISDYEKDFFTAACILAKEDCDVRIYTHLTAGTGVKEQADFFERHGVNPKQVCIGHICGNSDTDLQISLAKKGFFLGYDRLGLTGFDGCPDDSVRMDQIVKIVNAGCGNKVMLSTDRIGYNYGRQNDYVGTDTFNSMCLDQKWEKVFEKIIPGLLERGMSKEAVQALVVDNPASYLG